MSIIVIPFTFSAGAVIIASQHNSNFSTIYNDHNGNIDNTNIIAAAGIVYSKLNLTGSIVNADINSSAAIVDSKLATISTAGKVSGAALTSLSSIPSGAGIIPTANLPTLGALTFISNTSLAAVTTSGNIAITNTNHYFVKFRFTTMSVTDAIWIRFNGDTTATYRYITRGFDFGATADNTQAASGASQIVLDNGNIITTLVGVEGWFYIYPQYNSTGFVVLSGHMTAQLNSNSNVIYYDFNAGWNGNGNAATGFNIQSAVSANLTGNVYLYKISTS